MGTLLLSGDDIRRLASPGDFLGSAQAAFLGLAQGRYEMPQPLHVSGPKGMFHCKSAAAGEPPRAVFKINANFPDNPLQHGLPSIQGLVALFDTQQGRVLALMDSIELTARRTAAATALAARHLARHPAGVVAIIGCGAQAGCHLHALREVIDIQRVHYFDIRPEAMQSFESLLRQLQIAGERAASGRDAALAADIVVTLTTATVPILHVEDIASGAFVAGVGADSGTKQELAADVLRGARVVVDSRAQAAAMGDLHHALADGLLSLHDVHAELGDIVSGKVVGRTTDREVIVFDSTGVAAQDLEAADMIYRRACRSGAPEWELARDALSLSGQHKSAAGRESDIELPSSIDANGLLTE